MNGARPALLPALVWSALGAALTVPVVAAATSPLLAWRDAAYVAAGFSGVAGMVLLALQPLLAGGHLPGLGLRLGRRLHAVLGGGLVAAVGLHVAGLWLTSPPDVIDVLLLRSPTPFAIWGVGAMWAVLATALLAASRRRLGMPPRLWRRAHTGLAGLIVLGSVMHAMLIEGTMGTASKAALCALALAVTAWAVYGAWSPSRPAPGRR